MANTWRAMLKGWDSAVMTLTDEQLDDRRAMATARERAALSTGRARNPKAARQWRARRRVVEEEIARRASKHHHDDPDLQPGPGGPPTRSAGSMDCRRGDLVLRVTDQGHRPARILIGPHTDGEFEIVILVDPEHWPDGPEAGPLDDPWDEWMYAWPVECLAPHPDNGTVGTGGDHGIEGSDRREGAGS